MAGPRELSFNAVRDFMINNGGKVKNHDLVKHFKKFLTKPENRGKSQTRSLDFFFPCRNPITSLALF